MYRRLGFLRSIPLHFLKSYVLRLSVLFNGTDQIVSCFPGMIQVWRPVHLPPDIVVSCSFRKGFRVLLVNPHAHRLVIQVTFRSLYRSAFAEESRRKNNRHSVESAHPKALYLLSIRYLLVQPVAETPANSCGSVWELGLFSFPRALLRSISGMLFELNTF